MGIPFLWRGHDPRMGLDCFGLVQYLRDLYEVTEEFPKAVHDYLAIVGCESSFDSRELIELLDGHAQRVSTAQHMDLVLLEVGDDFVLGTVLEMPDLSVAYMGLNGSNLKTMARVVRSLHGVWRYGAQ
jgi:hypothetical protein